MRMAILANLTPQNFHPDYPAGRRESSATRQTWYKGLPGRPALAGGSGGARGDDKDAMMGGDDLISRALLQQEIEEFLYREADLLDERRYDEWLALLAEDVRYWMPMRRNVKVDDRAREFHRDRRDISWFD